MGLFGEPKMAMCRECGAPLISTCAFPKYEFYCLECGWLCGFMSPAPAAATPELDARHAALQAEWEEHAGTKLITPRSWYRSERCSECGPDTPHEQHASEEEREADRAARQWLAERAGKAVVANG